MVDGFIRVAAITPRIKIGNVTANVSNIKENIELAKESGVKLMVFPELCITGASCKDLFFQDTLLEAAREGLLDIADATKNVDAIIFLGLPIEYRNRLYNACAVISGGEILGIIPKSNLTLEDSKYFDAGFEEERAIDIGDKASIIGTNIIFNSEAISECNIAVAIGDDISLVNGTITSHVGNGANLIVNPSATIAYLGSKNAEREEISYISKALDIAVIRTNPTEGESTTDVVYSGYNYIVEAGNVLEESFGFKASAIITELDMQLVAMKRRSNNNTYVRLEEYAYVDFELEQDVCGFTRTFDTSPMLPKTKEGIEKMSEEILNIQCAGLRQRLEATNCKNVVVGISGGLDSTLTLLVCARTFDDMGLDRSGITAITMPGFGTTDRTYDNAVTMIHEVKATFKEISIKEAMTSHFLDIGHNINDRNVTYENAQARERTQILMDVANDVNGMVIGTGDLSELALGWATYNGDHMSMYAVNANVFKTFMQHIVRYYANTYASDKLKAALLDVLETPISPELLPANEGEIAQKTEDLVGPYELHDFYLYYFMTYRCSPSKLYRIACAAFDGSYSREELLKWEKNFYKRFFAQQYKRSCSADGPKALPFDLSPRGGFAFVSDADSRIWLSELEALEV